MEYALQKRLLDKVKKVAFDVSNSNTAEAYIVCRMLLNEQESRYSPEQWDTVNMTEYVDVTNSPRGNYKTAVAEWQETCYIDAQTSYFRKLNVDFIVYNYKGEQLMTYNRYMKSSDSEIKMLDEMIKEFVDELKDARKVCGNK